MIYLIRFGIGVVNLIFSVVKRLPLRDKIVYLSRQSDEEPVDFQMMIEKMRILYPQYSHIVLAKKMQDGCLGKVKYLFHMIRQMYHIATAKGIILDSYCILVSVLSLKKEQVVIQMWHALGALKKFGYSILDKKEGSNHQLAHAMKMHHNYTYVFCSSTFCKQYYVDAFHQPVEKMKVFPLPRVEMLLDSKWQKEEKEKILSFYPKLQDAKRKNILYAPTFRKGEERLKEAAEQLMQKIDYEKYNLIIKLHPLSDVHLESREHVVVDQQFSTESMLNVCDVFVTDYSATMVEAALLEKPIYFYVFDFENYLQERDFYIDFEKEFSGLMGQDVESVIRNLEAESCSLQRVKAFSDKMVEVGDKRNYTEKICDFIVEQLK